MSKESALSLFSEVPTNNVVSAEQQSYTMDPTAVILWDKCLLIIRDNVSEQVFKTWFEPIKAVKWNSNQLTVVVPSNFFCEWIEENFYSLLEKTIHQVLGKSSKLFYQIVVDDASDDSLENRTIKRPGLKFDPTTGSNTQFMVSDQSYQEFETCLNPRYSFDNFISGESNQLACSAGMAVGANPGGTKYNPLLIYGDSGLGKTHLAQAIGNYIVSKNKRARVLYTTSEHFTMEFINAIQNNQVNDFINRYRKIDTLIVDDIQFFAGKEKTQDNFFHTFNALHQAGKQLILTSDKPPRDLKDLDDRLISRFQWGLTADVQPPEYEMRMAIIQKKSNDEGIELPSEIVEFIARNVTSQVRDIEGTLIKLIAKVTLDGKELSLELAKQVVYGVANLEPQEITIDEIKETVSNYYNIPVEQVESKSRKHEITLARQMAMYLAKKLTSMSLKNIGANFSKRDHSTVLHSCSAIDNYLVTDVNVKLAYEKLYKKLKHN